MAIAYTAPTWSDDSGQGISASQLQALCNCMESLVQGSDKALHNIAINGSTITLTFADGSIQDTVTTIKSISSITKTGTSGLVDTYTITMSDGTTSTFTVTNGNPGGGDMYISEYDPDEEVKNAGGIPAYVSGLTPGGRTILTDTLTAGATTLVFTDESITDTSLIDIYTDDYSVNPTDATQSGTTVTLTFDAQATNVSVKLVVSE